MKPLTTRNTEYYIYS